jgi:hypothetical protein
MRKLLMIGAAVLAFSTAAKAEDNQSMTGRELYEMCSMPEPTMPTEPKGKIVNGKQVLDTAGAMINYFKTSRVVSNCRAYLLGHADGISAFSALYGAKDCVPNGVLARDMAELYVKFYRNHPEQRHKEAVNLVTATFIDAFGCHFERN